MATEPLEMDDMSKICGALLVNIGTMGAAGFESMMLAGMIHSSKTLELLTHLCLGTAANKYRKPIVFDPVGVGASDFRKGSVKSRCFSLFQCPVFDSSPFFSALEHVASKRDQRECRRTSSNGWYY